MDIRIPNRVALITGGSRGLGLAMAEKLAVAGTDVALLARRAGELEAARAQVLAKAKVRVAIVPCDVADAGQLAAAWTRVTGELGRVDILINNAGSSRRGPIETVTDADWQADFDLKLMAAVRLVRLAVPGMKERRWGRIINIVNTLAKAPSAASAPTSVTRAAGIALTKALSQELAPHNILVNALCVGNIMSDQWPRFHARDGAGMTFDAFMKQRGASIPLGRVGEADEFASVACFLCSDAGGYVTGTAINVDGGMCPVV